jgi:hypothetical protein
MREARAFSPQEAEIIDALRAARASLARVEKLMGFALDPSWVPLSIRSDETDAIVMGATRAMCTRPVRCVRGRALVIHGAASSFELLSLRVGRQPVLDIDPRRPMPCEQFAYDNPPRLLDFPWAPVGIDVTIAVRNIGSASQPFRATIWCQTEESLPPAKAFRSFDTADYDSLVLDSLRR